MCPQELSLRPGIVVGLFDLDEAHLLMTTVLPPPSTDIGAALASPDNDADVVRWAVTDSVIAPGRPAPDAHSDSLCGTTDKPGY
jgi:hypothetical protein